MRSLHMLHGRRYLKQARYIHSTAKGTDSIDIHVSTVAPVAWQGGSSIGHTAHVAVGASIVVAEAITGATLPRCGIGFLPSQTDWGGRAPFLDMLLAGGRMLARTGIDGGYSAGKYWWRRCHMITWGSPRIMRLWYLLNCTTHIYLYCRYSMRQRG